MEIEEKQTNYPFIKNRYYPGKLMHAGDFVHEQEYGNQKLEFLNKQFHGQGIIDGLAAETSSGGLIVRAGSAVDGRGRMLVVPEDIRIRGGELPGLPRKAGEECILGLSYAEKTVETERAYLAGEEGKYQPSRTAETFELKAYSLEEWEALDARTAEAAAENLFEERVLYEDKTVRLLLKIPFFVPADSTFCVRLEARAAQGRTADIGYRCGAGLEGACFWPAGVRQTVFESREAALNGRLCREWTVCTDENRTLPVVLSLDGLTVLSEGGQTECRERFQFPVRTVPDYEREVWRLLSDTAKGGNMEWVPLARLRTKRTEEDGGVRIDAVETEGVRRYAANPRMEEILRFAKRRGGIAEIPWRHGGYRPEPSPQPAPVPTPVPLRPDREEIAEIAEAAWEKRVRRGVTAVPVPGRYRRGRVLCTEEISHGFPGEEVFIRYGRLYEENPRPYWEKDKTVHTLLCGNETLFGEERGRLRIVSAAVRQNVEAGTFRIAFTLKKGKGREREREVVIAWTAVRAT